MKERTNEGAANRMQYKSPMAKEIFANLQRVICQSCGTEKFNLSSNSYDDDDWE